MIAPGDERSEVGKDIQSGELKMGPDIFSHSDVISGIAVKKETFFLPKPAKQKNDPKQKSTTGAGRA